MRGASEPRDASRCSDTATAPQNTQGHWDVQHVIVLLDPLRAACAVAASRITRILVKSQGIISTTEKKQDQMHTDTHIRVYVNRKLKGKIRIRQERLSPVPKQQVSLTTRLQPRQLQPVPYMYFLCGSRSETAAFSLQAHTTGISP